MYHSIKQADNHMREYDVFQHSFIYTMPVLL